MVTKCRQYRQAKELRQQDLADMLGVQQATVSNWEHGVHVPRGATLRKRLETILGAPIAVLLETESAATQKNDGAAILGNGETTRMTCNE